MLIYKIYKALYGLGDKLEDHVRGYLSHYPIIYALVGGTGIVIFWRGVWHTADYIMAMATAGSLGISSTDLSLGVWWDGPLSILLGAALLLMTGVFVSNFIGNEILISGLKGEKKIAEKTEKEVRTEEERLTSVRSQIGSMHAQMATLKQEMDQLLEVNGKTKV
ncbi:MAG: hypothetical protein KGJ93_02290 [Patescibacteria group bacterium]|nr:hypothetical protein [Patescibacteria group bacterium]